MLHLTPRRLLSLALLTLLAPLADISLHAAIPLRQQIDISGYVIHADLDPATGRLSATTTVTFTSLEDLTSVVFGLNNGLQITSLTAADNATLTPERNATDSTVRVGLATPMPKGATSTWTFTYAGMPSVDTSPVDGINFVHVADPVSILLYPGRWFPLSLPGLYTDRFTAEIHVTVPTGERVVGSGISGQHALPNNRTDFDFNWTRPGFPGTIVAGKFLPPVSAPDAPNVHVLLTAANKSKASQFANTVAKEFEYMTNEFGAAESPLLYVVELPADSVSAAWAPEIIAIRPDRGSMRLLANTVAHQWWGSEVSPDTLNDAWITNGMSRYAELMYLEDQDGKTALQTAITDTEAGALAYDTEPLTSLARVDPFSPQFQSMTLEKGAMVFHMLRWEMGDDTFTRFLRAVLSQNIDKSIRTSQVQQIAEAQSNLQLTPFFSQWVDGTGAPDFGNNYEVFRLGKGKGFRTTGSVTQDLDLFKMPVELRIETEGKTVERRVDLSGTESAYNVETFGRPRRITIDPDNWLLKSTPDLAVRVAVLKGQEDVAQGDLLGAITEYQKALDEDRGSSLANYRLAEVFMMQKNYQSAANSFRDALRGDGDPRWIEVWCHINLGKIFDITGQRERAVNEYRLAIQTNDNTQGAINEARALMQKPYQRNNSSGT
ncbi:MAG TPA: M1 family aminopeptidase [Acidobacteriaceae bacterium]|jgi:tetratricopeptide (TPR) repeat protein|nr:M1 family aminopeptidase [Acidobacteriaceae bacterium]